jgi:hypothetical protein
VTLAAVIALLLCASVAFGSAMVAWTPVVRIARRQAAFAAELRDQLAGSVSDEDRIATTDAALADFEQRLDVDADGPKAGAWIAIAGGVCSIIAGYWLAGWQIALVGLPIAFAGVIASLAARHALGQRQESARVEVDRLVVRQLGDLVDREVALPRRRRPRFKKKTPRR